VARVVKESVMRKFLVAVASVAVVSLLPGLAGAEGTSCASPTVIVPDGRLTTSTIPNAATYVFMIQSRPGNSYSVEFHNVLGPAVQTPGTLSVFSDAACGVTVTTTNAAGSDPGDVNGERRTFIATTTATRFLLTNNSGGSLTYSFTVSDTTMYSPAWSTHGTYNTYYSFMNTTGAPVTGTIALFTTTGTSVGTPVSITVNPNSTAAVNTVSFGATRNASGTARFTHNGPPGAILAEAAIANFSITPTPYVQVVKFTTARESTH